MDRWIVERMLDGLVLIQHDFSDGALVVNYLLLRLWLGLLVAHET